MLSFPWILLMQNVSWTSPMEQPTVLLGASHSRKIASKHVVSTKGLFLYLAFICMHRSSESRCPLLLCVLFWLAPWSNNTCLLNLLRSIWLIIFILRIWTESPSVTLCFFFVFLYCANRPGTSPWSSCLDLTYLLVPSHLSFLILSWL